MYTCHECKKTIEGPYFYLRKRINVSLKLVRKMFSEHHGGIRVYVFDACP